MIPLEFINIGLVAGGLPVAVGGVYAFVRWSVRSQDNSTEPHPSAAVGQVRVQVAEAQYRERAKQLVKR